MDYIRVPLRSRPNLGFNMNYFNFFVVAFVHLELCIKSKDIEVYTNLYLIEAYSKDVET